MFKPGDHVQIVEKPRQRGKKPIPLIVVEDKRSEIDLKDESTGEVTTFAHKAEFGGWKMLFPGLDGERCFSRRGPTYDILETRKN